MFAILISVFLFSGCQKHAQTDKLNAQIKTQQGKIDELQRLYSEASARLTDSEQKAATCQQEFRSAATNSDTRIAALEDEITKLKTENESLRRPRTIKEGVEEIKAMQRRAAEQLKNNETNQP